MRDSTCSKRLQLIVFSNVSRRTSRRGCINKSSIAVRSLVRIDNDVTCIIMLFLLSFVRSNY
jgi:hypothetical protein